MKPVSSSREGGGSRGGGGREAWSVEGSNPGRGGFLGFSFLGGGGSHLCIGAPWADWVHMSEDELGHIGIASNGEIGGLPGSGVGLGEGLGVSVADVVQRVKPREVGIESGAVNRGRSREAGLLSGLRRGGNRVHGCLGAYRRGCAYPM